GLVRRFHASDEFSRVQGKLFSLAANDGFERGLSMHRIKDEFVVVLKKMANFMLDTRVSPPTTKESTMTPASKSLELSANVDLTASAVASPKMTDDTIAAKYGHAFVHRIFVALKDVVELVKVGSGR
ncbi:hypothetical protein Tco_0259535, partial [Tanacetum coccineum]